MPEQPHPLEEAHQADSTTDIESYLFQLEEGYESTVESIKKRAERIPQQLTDAIARAQDMLSRGGDSKAISPLLTELQKLEGKFGNIDISFHKRTIAEGFSTPGARDEAERKKVYSEYAYPTSPLVKETKSEYLKGLVDKLRTTSEINRFLTYMYRYSMEKDLKNKVQKVVNGSPLTNELFQQPAEFVTDYHKSHQCFYGDCDDIGILFEHIFREQGEDSFCFSMEHSDNTEHLLCGSFKTQSDGVLVAKIVDTTGKPNGAQAWCRELVGKKGESKKKLFIRLLQSYKGVADEIANYNMEYTTLDFLLEDGSVYLIPANFRLATRYQEIRKLLQSKNYKGFIKILDVEIWRDYDNAQLSLAKLQFQVLLQEKSENLDNTIWKIVQSFAKNPMPQVASSANETVYYLLEKKLSGKAAQLFPTIVKYHKGEDKYNYRDTLSDVFVANRDFDKAFKSDKSLVEEFVQKHNKVLKKGRFRKIWPENYFELMRNMKWVKQRIKNNPAYKKYILSQFPLSKSKPGKPKLLSEEEVVKQLLKNMGLTDVPQYFRDHLLK